MFGQDVFREVVLRPLEQQPLEAVATIDEAFCT